MGCVGCVEALEGGEVEVMGGDVEGAVKGGGDEGGEEGDEGDGDEGDGGQHRENQRLGLNKMLRVIKSHV